MSSTLAPIHYLIYEKIQKQEAFIQVLLLQLPFIEKEMMEDMLNSTFNQISLSPLENMIDLKNIHGWLSNQISIVESRYAYLITNVLKKDLLTLQEIKELAYKQGEKEAKPFLLLEAFQMINHTFLDGMPCDHIIEIKDKKENYLNWIEADSTHEKYWKDVQGNINYYYAIKEEWIKGLLSKSRIKIICTNNFYHLETL